MYRRGDLTRKRGRRRVGCRIGRVVVVVDVVVDFGVVVVDVVVVVLKERVGWKCHHGNVRNG